MEEEAIVDTLDYRGIHVDFIADDPGQQMCCMYKGEPISFGTYNMNYKDDMMYLIDRDLDTIEYFNQAILKFVRVRGHNDVHLLKQGRVLRIWLDVEDSSETRKNLVEEAKTILAAFEG